MDLLWVKNKTVVHAFEVECTTTMTSALQRGSNLPASVPKTMLLPEEREKDFERKMKSPLFSEHFAKDNWNLLFFDALRDAYAKSKQKTSLEKLFGEKKNSPAVATAPTNNTQLGLFGLAPAPNAEEEHTMAVAEDPPAG